MNKQNKLFAVAVASVATLVLVALIPLGAQDSATKISAVPVAWEYRTLGPSGDGSKNRIAMNELGADGWELVSAATYWNEPARRSFTTFYFKRQKR